jgi:3-hydroxybutyryl-CoA dehydrogenase
MAYTLPRDVNERPVAIVGAGTLGSRIACVYAAGGTDVRIFDVSADQREAARDFVAGQLEESKRLLEVDPPRAGRVELLEDLKPALDGA